MLFGNTTVISKKYLCRISLFKLEDDKMKVNILNVSIDNLLQTELLGKPNQVLYSRPM